MFRGRSRTTDHLRLLIVQEQFDPLELSVKVDIFRATRGGGARFTLESGRVGRVGADIGSGASKGGTVCREGSSILESRLEDLA